MLILSVWAAGFPHTVAALLFVRAGRRGGVCVSFCVITRDLRLQRAKQRDRPSVYPELQTFKEGMKRGQGLAPARASMVSSW